jgi:hypothetical protein
MCELRKTEKFTEYGVSELLLFTRDCEDAQIMRIGLVDMQDAWQMKRVNIYLRPMRDSEPE